LPKCSSAIFFKMAKGNVFVWSAICFCTGTIIASVIDHPGAVFAGLLILSLFFAIFMRASRIVALFLFACALGCLYPFLYKSFSSSFIPPDSGNFHIEGKIISYPSDYGGLVKFNLKLADGKKLNLTAESYEDLKYGNILALDCKKDLLASGKPSVFCKNTEIIGDECKGFMCSLFSIRKRMSENFKRILSPNSSALADGIIFGDKSGFTPEFKDDLSATGTTHIVALSGFNITIVASFFAIIFFLLPVKWRPFAATLGIIIFVLLVGPSASVVRAAIMGLIAMLTKNMGRLVSVKGPMALAALLMVVSDPFIIMEDAGFILSFAAFFGIVFIAPRLKKLFFREREIGFMGSVITECFSAELAVSPVIPILFGRFNWLSFIPNAMIIWSVPLAMFFSFVSGILSFISNYLAFPFSILAESLLSYEIGIINFFARYL